VLGVPFAAAYSHVTSIDGLCSYMGSLLLETHCDGIQSLNNDLSGSVLIPFSCFRFLGWWYGEFEMAIIWRHSLFLTCTR
jgi:hypothetical protein